jgi:thymidine phosphorylase
MFLPQEVVRKKRDREHLTASEIRQFILGVGDGSVSDAQIAAFTMATCLNGMSLEEQVALTFAMRDSGRVTDWKRVLPSGSRVVEKHSSGGVGDEKVTLIVTPLVAACGIYLPNISGRSLGHTGGELDLLESIPGYRIEPSRERFEAVVRDVGTAIIGPTPDLAPADRAIFHVRDITATVESIPLIVSSILSKKLAAGADGLVMTVPFGTGAFMRRPGDAVHLAQGLIEVASAADLPMVAWISDLDQVLGDSVGNSLEVLETIEFLQGDKREARLLEVVLQLAAEILVMADVTDEMENAKSLIHEKLADGSGASKFGAMVAAMGGPADLLEHPLKYLQQAPIVEAIYASEAGFIVSMDCFAVGMALVELGAGRAQPRDAIDYAVGISDVVHLGDSVVASKPLCTLHARTKEQWHEAAAKLRRAFVIRGEAGRVPPVLLERLASHQTVLH